MSKYYFLFLVIGGLLFCGATPLEKGGKKLKGNYYEKGILTDQIEGDSKCKVDSGEGVVIQIIRYQENPQFGDETETELLVWLREWPSVGEKYYLTPENSQICFQERGKLLLFETFICQGWIQLLESPAKGKLKGNIELNLVEPHHNFSNSDFQFVGGQMSLKVAEVR